MKSKSILHNQKYIITSMALMVYMLIINRASYLSVYVNLILWMTFLVFYKPVKNVTSGVMWMLSLFYVLIGIINTNTLQNILSDFVVFSPMILIVLGSETFKEDYIFNQLEGIKRLQPICIILYYIIFTYMGFSWAGVSGVRFAYNEETHLVLNAPLTPLMFIPIFICYHKMKGNWIVKLSIWLGVIATLHMGLITLTRTMMLGVMVILLMKFVIGQKGKSFFKYFLFAGVATIGIIYAVDLYFGEFSELIMGKFDADDGSNTSRIEEATTYFSKCGFFQIVFGKGFGGLKTFHGESFIGGETMLHMGWAHLMMKGGIILLLVIYTPLFYIVIKDFMAKNYAFVLMALYFLITDQAHNHYQGMMGMVIYWFLVYFRFYNRKALRVVDKYDVL